MPCSLFSTFFTGFASGQRALLTAVDIQALCTIEGCAAGQLNTDPSAFANAVPEPGTFLLISFAAPILIGIARKQAKA